MTSTERLGPEKFDELLSFHDGARPDPKSSIAIVTRDAEKIVGRIFMIAPVHIEGPYLLPEYRGGTLAKQMVDVAEAEARAAGIKSLFAYGMDAQLEDYLDRLGFKQQPITVWKKEL